jgi:hypothetical protein
MEEVKKPIYAIDIYRILGMVTLNINEECYKDVAFSDALEIGDSCEDCEFCIVFPVYIGANRAYDASYCEKGYWKDEI